MRTTLTIAMLAFLLSCDGDTCYTCPCVPSGDMVIPEHCDDDTDCSILPMHCGGTWRCEGATCSCSFADGGAS